MCERETEKGVVFHVGQARTFRHPRTYTQHTLGIVALVVLDMKWKWKWNGIYS